MRAVAVLGVILFHADFSVSDQNLVPGGFLGVDIFFVISGYLISSIIIREMERQSFSFASFYERRARRILPVLMTVTLVSTPMAWMFLIPEAMREYCYSIIGSILFSSNFYFWSEDPYWATGGTIRPFLHTWSLAVEEQFYLIMPLVLLLLCRLENKARLTLICILALASLGIAQWTSSTRPEFAFYLLPARMWELLAGTMMAVLEQQRGRANSTRGTQSPLTQHLPTFGFFLVILPMFMFSSDTQHPSVLTLVPVIGTMLIIGFANGTDLTVKILSSRPFVAIGLMSYGLYMWHFPIFSFGEIILRDEGNAASVILIFLSVLLASITYFSIERPARNRSLISIKSFVAIAGTATLLIMTFSVIGLVNGYAFRFPAFLAELPKAERIARHQWTRSTGGSAPDKRIIVVGDSHMQMLAPELRKLAFDAGYEFAVSTYTGCQLIAGANRVRSADLSRHKRCTSALQEERLSFIEQSKPSFVILGGRLPLILEETRFDNQEGGFEGKMNFFIQDDGNSLDSKTDRNAFIKGQYHATVDRIIKAGHRVILIYPIPEVGWNVPEKLAEKIIGASGDAREIAATDPVTTGADVFKARTAGARELLDHITDDGIIRIYPEHLFCNTAIADRCVTHGTENLFYRDDDHLSDIGARMLAELVMSAIEKSD